MTGEVIRTPTYRDLDLDFVMNPGTNDISVKVGKEAVKRSVRNLVETNFYDRPFRSNLGSNVNRLLFEPITPITKALLEKAIIEVLNNFEPRVTVLNVNAVVTPDWNGFNVGIVFYINNVPDPVVITIFLSRIR